MCKHCGKEMDDHSFLTLTCPRFATNGIRIGDDYGHEYTPKDDNEDPMSLDVAGDE